MRVLVTGWFSLDDGEITAGDMLACETVLAAAWSRRTWSCWSC